MTDNSETGDAADRRELPLLRGRDLIFCLYLLLLLDRLRRLDAARAHADPDHLHPVHAAGAARQRSLSEAAAARELHHRRDLHRDLGLCVLLHDDGIRGSRHLAGRNVGPRRPRLGRADDPAHHRIRPQASHAAVHPQHRADPLRGLRLHGSRHVPSRRPLLGARDQRHEHRDGDRHLLQPAADRAYDRRLVPPGVEPAARLRLH